MDRSRRKQTKHVSFGGDTLFDVYGVIEPQKVVPRGAATTPMVTVLS